MIPMVVPNYLGHPDDLKTSAEGVKLSVELFYQKKPSEIHKEN